MLFGLCFAFFVKGDICVLSPSCLTCPCEKSLDSPESGPVGAIGTEFVSGRYIFNDKITVLDVFGPPSGMVCHVALMCLLTFRGSRTF